MDNSIETSAIAGYYDLLGDFIKYNIEKPKKPKEPKSKSSEGKPPGLLKTKAIKAKAAFLKFLQAQISLFGVLDVEAPEVADEPLLPVIPSHLLGETFTVKYAIEPLRKKQRGLYPEEDQWNDHNVYTAHQEFLISSMRILTYPGDSIEVINDKLDVISWIFAGEWINYKGRLVRAEYAPFSFKACCMLANVDHTVLQDFVYNTLPQEFREHIWDVCAA